MTMVVEILTAATSKQCYYANQLRVCLLYIAMMSG